LNRRVGRKVNGVLVQGFLYEDQLNPVAELDGTGNVVSRFVYGARGNVPDYMIKNDTTYRIVVDHLGSVRLVVNTASGAVVQRLRYDEFGQELDNTNPGFQPFGFVGGLYDRTSGLVRFGTRDYDPALGRWTAKDPLGLRHGSLGLYTYAAADPVNRSDPSGLITTNACPPTDPCLDRLNDRRSALEMAMGVLGSPAFQLGTVPSGKPLFGGQTVLPTELLVEQDPQTQNVLYGFTQGAVKIEMPGPDAVLTSLTANLTTATFNANGHLNGFFGSLFPLTVSGSLLTGQAQARVCLLGPPLCKSFDEALGGCLVP
jgi:RHS repeat-associated protein